MRFDDIFKIEIEDLTFGGAGFGRIDGKICFVPRVLPGEQVEVEIKKEKPGYYTSSLLKVLKSSPERIKEECPFGSFCPGCAYQHCDYEYENGLKDRQMRDFLERNIPVDQCHFDSWQAPEEPLGYRNKLVLHAQKDGARTLLGYMNEGNQNVLDIPECPLACRQINEKLSELRSSKGFFHSIHNGHTLTLRYTQNDGVIYWRNSPKSGLSWLKEELPFGKFSVPAGSFHQINAFGSAALIENTTAILKAEKPEAVLDLYCGSGLLGVTAALAGVPQVKGIEIDKQAVESARYNLQQHGLNNAEIIAADAGKVFDKIVEDLPDSTILIVDPPRGGLGKKVKKSITETKIKGMIYISCGPDTLGRDLKMMHNSGFNLKYARMINMFPRTSHFETFTYLTRD